MAEKNKMTRQEKWILSIFGILAAGILIFGFINIASRLKVPFLAIDGKSSNTPKIDLKALNNTSNSDNAEELKNKDTDGDGLSDYEELNFYGTSPYLKDTDSDGYPDNVEIEQGEDPTCPRGKQCHDNAVENSPSVDKVDFGKEADISDLGKYLSNESANNNQNSQIDPQLANLLSGKATADELRKILIKSGVPEEEVNKIDDKTLIQTYQESLSETYKENNLGQKQSN